MKVKNKGIYIGSYYIGSYEKINIKDTLFSNIPFFIFFLFFLVFFFSMMSFLNSIQEGAMKLISLIVLLFTLIRLLSMIGKPRMCYRTKKGELILE